MLGLTIGKKHTAYDFGLRLLTFNVSSPDPVVNEVEIPGMDGNLDLSETLTGETIYKKRTLTAEFLMEEHDETELQKRTDAIRNSYTSHIFINTIHVRTNCMRDPV